VEWLGGNKDTQQANYHVLEEQGRIEKKEWEGRVEEEFDVYHNKLKFTTGQQ
jgi:hypothetical protein